MPTINPSLPPATNPLPHFDNKSQPAKPCLFHRIRDAYNRAIGRLVDFLYRHQWHTLGMILGTLLQEPFQVLRAGFTLPANWKKKFSYHGLNPTNLTDAQQKKRPILLIHGNLHNQTAWIELSKKLQRTDLGPVFTVNLPSGEVTEKDFEIVDKKIQEIKALYEKKGVSGISVDLVGHSRGCYLAQQRAYTDKQNGNRIWSLRPDIGKVILIGTPLESPEINQIKRIDPNYTSRIYEITGQCDVLVREKSLLPANNHVDLKTGHLGLLYSRQMHERVIEVLKS